ncbi:MAG TPA: transposase [Blastocatellia bacterium]|nr:transposase [Blastocatellia bacterium]
MKIIVLGTIRAGTSPAPTSDFGFQEVMKPDKTYTRRNSLRLSCFNYSSQRIYFTTLVVLDRRNLFHDPLLARTTINCLEDLRQKMRFNLYRYCLMPDHLHALIGIGESGKTLGVVVGTFKSLSTRLYWQRYEGRLWQRQFFDHIIRNEHDFNETLSYIELNPVRNGLVIRPEEWPYTGGIDNFSL